MERKLIETREQAEALVGKLVKFEWYDMWQPEKFVGVVVSYDTRSTSLRLRAADGRARSLSIPYPAEPVYATVFYPGCDMQPDPRPIPASDAEDHYDSYDDPDDDLDDLLSDF